MRWLINSAKSYTVHDHRNPLNTERCGTKNGTQVDTCRMDENNKPPRGRSLWDQPAWKQIPALLIMSVAVLFYPALLLVIGAYFIYTYRKRNK
jgi:hypothetical protein